jgi:hypothetical protein
MEDFSGRKISYFAVLLDGPFTGAAKKIIDQTQTWKANGVEVTVYIITHRNLLSQWMEFPDFLVVPDSSGFLKFIVRYKLFKKILKDESSVVYVRDSYPFFLPKPPSSKSLVLEVQTLLQQELRLRSHILYLLSCVLDFFYLSKFNKFIFVSYEISISKRFSKVKKEARKIVIGNGIDFKRVLPLPTRDQSKPLSLIFAGTDSQPWHGIDEILKLAKCMPDFEFNIVGVTQGIYPNSLNVNFHGQLSTSNYVKIAQDSVAGLGTLMLSRKQMSEASSLKSREYLALGLPVIQRHLDTDFQEPIPFILQLPIDSRPLVDFIDQIRKFCYQWMGQRVPREEILNIDTSIKEKDRLIFLFHKG